jgi:uncharacterized protein
MKAVVFWGGWDGHQPEEVAGIFTDQLREAGFDVDVYSELMPLASVDWPAVDLVVPCWTMGEIPHEALNAVTQAVAAGTGIAGCHGGMNDSFRAATEWQFMTGGQWVSHPGNDGVKYRVDIKDRFHEITRDMDDFDVSSEQYYLHVDPAVKVLASTRFPVADGPHATNGEVDMPVVYTKMYGQGKVFYCALGHQADIVRQEPVLEIMRRGLLWAAR